MRYILDRSGRIVASADGPVDVHDLASRGETIVSSPLDLPPDRVEVIGFPVDPVVVERVATVSVRGITVTTSAEDHDGDGLPELPANGRARAKITAMLRDEEGEVVDEPIEIKFRTTAGRLSERRVTAQSGTATVELTASRETVTATIHIAATGFAPADLVLEFVPTEEKKES